MSSQVSLSQPEIRDAPRHWFSVLGVGIATAIFATDLNVELGVATAVGYVLAVGATYISGSPRAVWMNAIFCVVLTILGLLYSSGASSGQVVANRVVAVIVIWLTAVLFVRVLSLLASEKLRVELAEKFAAESALRHAEDVRRSQAIASVLEDLRIERTKLEQSERQYGDLYENSPDLYALVNAESMLIEQCNHTLADELGRPKQEIVGSHVGELCHNKCREQLEKAIGECRRNGFVVNADMKLQRRNGEPIDVLLNASAVYDDANIVTSQRLVWRDISERIAAIEALREQEAQTTALLNSTAEGIYGLDLDGNCTFANDACARLLGYDSVDDFIGENMHDMIHHTRKDGEHYPQSECCIFRASNRGNTAHADDEIYWRRDGTSFPAEYWSFPLTRDDRLVGSVVTFFDITERARMESRFQATVESAPMAMVMINEAGEIVLINGETEKLFGYPRDELLGQKIELLVPPRFRPDHPSLRDGYFQRPQSRRMGEGRELYGARKDGSEFPVELGLNPIETEEGMFVLSAIVDITERKMAEREIQRINEELRQKNQEMQQFVYTVSHDLKSPLVTCKGFVGMMKEDAKEERWDDMLDSVERVERATERMNELIKDLLQLSRIGVIRNEPEHIDVADVMQSMAVEFESRLESVGASLVIHDLDPIIADRVRLIEVFENLLSNAIKYGCRVEDPQITVSSESSETGVRYCVQDNGPGIAVEFQEKIFGLFQRLESDKNGTGVGLAAVARIMEIHGGLYGVESEPGAGAKFWVQFPHSDVATAAPLLSSSYSG